MDWIIFIERLLKPLLNETGAVTINHYDEMIHLVGVSTLNKFIDLDDTAANVFRAELYNSTHTFTKGNNARAQISANALATGNGYTNPGQGLTSVTWTEAAGTATWDAANVTWTASGGSIGPANFCVIYDDTVTVAPIDALMIDIAFGQAETAVDTATFNINFNASGIFTVA